MKSPATPESIDGLRSIVVLVFLCALIAIVYSPVGEFQFISLDDPQYVSANPIIANGLSQAGIRWAFTSSSFYWHPLTWMSHMLDVEIWGMNAGAHHVMNAVLHTANSVVLFFALQKLTSAPWRSGSVAAMFAIHPLHVESVAWVAERKDVLSTFFLMLSLLAYAGYVRSPTVRRMGLLSFVFAAGLLAKPMIATLPFALLLLDYWPLDRDAPPFLQKRPLWLALIVEKTPLFLLSLASIVITLVSQHAIVATAKLSLADRTRNAAVTYFLYLRDTLWPRGLAAFYPLDPPRLSFALIAVVALISLTLLFIRLRRKFPYLVVGWLWYLGMLVPVIGLVQAGDQGRADRFTYVPLIGIFVALVWIVHDLLAPMDSRKILRGSALIASTLGLAIVARRQVLYWKDDLALWTRVVSVTSNNYRAENHLGVALTDRGMLGQGIEHYQAAIRIWPDYPEGHNNLGTAYMDQHRYSDAVAEFKAAAKSKPRDPNFRYNLAVALDATGERNAAVAQVKAGLEIDPNFPSLLRAAEAFGISASSK